MRPKVLVVDDEAEFARSLSERLELRDYDARAVFCPEDALAVINSDPPDVVLLDYRVPGMGGADLFHAIKEFDTAIEVIMVTGHGICRTGLEGMESEAIDYLVKPVEIRDVVDKIEKALKRRGTRGNGPKGE
ncbi:MAG: response regulator [Alphaproteobacteria bacterium]|uniref:Response regulator n=1 Tax=Candidatus Nitrobium versatile TaxID=2884831 RepID=A0A953JD62_9BACT|nr:response regulator [Candidatus Nitrobium versatile]